MVCSSRGLQAPVSDSLLGQLGACPRSARGGSSEPLARACPAPNPRSPPGGSSNRPTGGALCFLPDP